MDGCSGNESTTNAGTNVGNGTTLVTTTTTVVVQDDSGRNAETAL